MTNDEKKLLIAYIKDGWSFKQIRGELTCSDVTIRNYMKIFKKQAR